jgi:rhodanese-related sulfurtransferase
MLWFQQGNCLAVCMWAITGLTAPAFAQGVNLTEDLAEARIVLNGVEVVIARNPDQTAVITGDFAKTSRACPPFCIQPMQPVTGVAGVGELEVIAFLQNDVVQGTGVLLDARLPEWFAKGSIPGAVNLPFAALSSDNPFRNDILIALGATPLGGDQFDYSAALDLTVFCNGVWSDQSTRALRALRAAGYPADKLHYYRGGMQDWQILGLTVSEPPPVVVAESQP